MKQPVYEWDENTGYAGCTYTDKYGRTSCGIAMCHKDDRDVMSWRNGQTIAEYRARIAYAKTKRNDERIALEALNRLYYGVKQSKHYNPKGYMETMLRRQIEQRTESYAEMKQYVKRLKADFRIYMTKMKELNQKYRDKMHPPLDL